MYLDMDVGAIACMREKGIIESLKLKRSVLLSASEAAEMILRVDDIIRAAPRFGHFSPNHFNSFLFLLSSFTYRRREG
jgi:chaperonin GroEL (HSP60 family)